MKRIILLTLIFSSIALSQFKPPASGSGGGGGVAGVSTFNTRSGDVVSATNDYSFSQIGGFIQSSQLVQGFGIIYNQADGTIRIDTAANKVATKSDLLSYVPTSRTVNSHALSSNVTVSASDVGLGNVTNTSDANKPVSTAQQTALDAKRDTSNYTFSGGLWIKNRTKIVTASPTWPTNPDSGQSWPTPNNSWLYSSADEGQMAIAGFSRTRNGDSTMAIGVGGFVINDHSNGKAWGMYSDVEHRAGAAFTVGHEYALKNNGSNLTSNSYAQNFGINGAWFAGGGDSAGGGGAALNPTNAAIVLIKNSNTFNEGIVIDKKALTGTDGVTGTGIAMEMAKGHTLNWRSQNGQGAQIRSDVATSGKDVGLIFGDDSVTIQKASGNLLAKFTTTGLGIGTTPAQPLDVLFSSSSLFGANLTNSNSSGKAAYSATNNDGTICTIGSYGSAFGATNFQSSGALASTAGLMLVPDANTASGGSSTIRFYAGGYQSENERMRLTSTGLCIGGVTSVKSLDVITGDDNGLRVNSSGEPNIGLFTTRGNSNDRNWEIRNGFNVNGMLEFAVSPSAGAEVGNSSAIKLTVTKDGVVAMSHYGAGAATFDASGNISSVSDERLKDIQYYYTGGLSDIAKVNPIVYKWNKKSRMETEYMYAGFSAQNVEKAIGEIAVGKNEDGYLSIQDRAIMAVMVNSIKELKTQQEELKAQVEELEKQLKKQKEEFIHKN